MARPPSQPRPQIEGTAPPTGVPESAPTGHTDASDPPAPVPIVWTLDDGSTSPYGPIERELRKDIGAIKVAGQLSGTVVAAAFELARTLDRGAGMATAAVARELREYIKILESAAGDDASTTHHRADLSTPL